jgi:anaerobic selenocysteine-containing dehydrogenase
MEEFVTACPRNCYSTCTFRVQVEGGLIKRILPFSDNLATPEGPCIKGLSMIERSNSGDRIKYPLLKTSENEFEKISFEKAIEIISRKLSYFRDNFGPSSVLWYTGSGMSGLTNEIGAAFWKEFGGPTTTFGNLCWPAGLEAVRLTMGDIKHNVPWDLRNANTLIIWGKNPAETNIQEMSFIASAREKGCKVIVIDTIRTQTAEKADIFLSPAAGTDAALAIAIAKVLVDNDMIDCHFIKKYVKGFEEYKNSLNISPEEAHKITGIPADTIRNIAFLIGKSDKVTFLPGYGIQRHRNGGQTIRSLLALAVITGNIGKSGSGFNYANLQSYVFDNIKEPLSYYPDKEKDKPFRRTISKVKLGEDMLMTAHPELKAAWIENGNPILQSPDSKKVIKAFNKLEFIVVVDQFLTDTARMADIVLPAKNMFEQTDIIGSYWSPYIQLKPAVTLMPGEVKPESEIYFYLSKKMGLGINNELVPEPGNENIERWLDNRIKGYSSLSLDDLRSGPVLSPGLQKIAWEDMKFNTPSGKIELYSREAEKRWGVSPLPCYVPLEKYKGIEKYPLLFLTPNKSHSIHSQYGNLKIIKELTENPAVEISPKDAGIRNIRDGNRVIIYNDNAEITSKARISSCIPAGSLVLHNGIWLDDGGGGNFLINGEETDMGHGAAFHDNYVEIKNAD